MRVRGNPECQRALGKREIKTSLHTEDYREARVFAAQHGANTERLFAQLRGQLQSATPRASPRNFNEVEACVITHFQADLQRNRVLFASLSPATGFTDLHREQRLEDAGSFVRELSDPTGEAANQAVFRAERAIFGEAGLQLALSPDEGDRLYDLILSNLLKSERQAIDQLLYRPLQQATATSKDTVTFASVRKMYVEEYTKISHAGIKRHRKIAAALDLAEEFFGSLLLRQISAAECRAFRDLLNELPSNLRKHFPDPNISLQAAVQQGRARSLKPLSGRTQATYLGALHMMLKWAKRERLISDNPAEGLVALRAITPLGEARRPFSPSMLQTIFSSDLFSNGRAAWVEANVGVPHQVAATRFWVPLLALFTGMRLNEICQLEVADVQLASDVWFISCNLEGRYGPKSLKNSFAKRRVPIHPELQKIGFIDYVNLQSGLLFPNLPLSETGHRSERFSRWFNETFLPRIKVKEPGIVFHSFRHSWRDALRNALITTDVVDLLGGWNTQKGSSQVYGGAVDINVLASELSRISYRELDLAHLVQDKGRDHSTV